MEGGPLRGREGERQERRQAEGAAHARITHARHRVLTRVSSHWVACPQLGQKCAIVQGLDYEVRGGCVEKADIECSNVRGIRCPGTRVAAEAASRRLEASSECADPILAVRVLSTGCHPRHGHCAHSRRQVLRRLNALQQHAARGPPRAGCGSPARCQGLKERCSAYNLSVCPDMNIRCPPLCRLCVGEASNHCIPCMAQRAARDHLTLASLASAGAPVPHIWLFITR